MHQRDPGFEQQATGLEHQWATDPRWRGIKRDYSASDVIALRGSAQIEHTLARVGAQRLWDLLQNEDYISTFGALSGSHLDQDIVPGGTRRNLTSADHEVSWSADVHEKARLLLCDAQTSGGLLIAVAPEKHDRLLKALSDQARTLGPAVGKGATEAAEAVTPTATG